ncbi:unnamed protein product [Timema podura]|uniref:Uncharacterized protein n=1 Tax=Timema podura TaxID=61482 RepID=A0ABN7P3D2_TIMPD|nr:unnamed protein product [Timema podura]
MFVQHRIESRIFVRVGGAGTRVLPSGSGREEDTSTHFHSLKILAT